MAPQLELQRIGGPADETDVMREQLEYLIEHISQEVLCGCSECQRYLKVRSILLEIFAEPPRANVQQIAPQFSKAA